MKKFFLFQIAVLFSAVCLAQKAYIVVPDSANINKYYYTGLLTQQDMLQDTSMKKWYDQSRSYYQPDSALVNRFKSAKEQKISFLVFSGTWCEDSHFVLPKLYMLQELSGMPLSSISVIGMDRNKKDPANIGAVLNVDKVPTIIAFKDGKELGRVAEYGKTGLWDKELSELFPK